jgi:hypothetical protein
MLHSVNKILCLNEVGSVNQIVQKNNPKIGLREGIGQYSYLYVESTTPKPYTQSQEITIPLTDSNVYVVEFHKSHFTLNIEVTLNFTTPDYIQIAPPCTDVPTPDDCTTILGNTDFIFIRFKNASDAIQPYRLQQNKIDIGGTLQNNSTLESFVYNQMKPQTEKSNKHGSYTLWEDV